VGHLYDLAMTRRRIGIFGGTFDPPHLGHLIVASEVRHRCGFDEVLLMVANDPWQKRNDRTITPAPLRLEMVTAAVAGRDGLRASALEIERGGATYTVDTVEQILRGDDTFDCTLILGADSLRSIATWHRSDELAALVDIVVVARPGTDATAVIAAAVAAEVVAAGEQRGVGWTVNEVAVPGVQISSTELRSRCRNGTPTTFLITDEVRSIIDRAGLYGVGR